MEATRPPTIVPVGKAAAFLAPLPIEVIADPEVIPDLEGPLDGQLAKERRNLVSLIARLGLTTLGSFAALPAADVLARFGITGAHAHRQAGGLDDRPPAAFAPPPSWLVDMELEPPAYDASPVVFAAKALADELFGRLAGNGLACTELRVVIETDHGERHERMWRRQPALTAAAVVDRVRWQLDGWAGSPPGEAGDETPTAPVTLIRLIPTEVVPDGGRQLDFWGGSAAADDRAWRSMTRLIAQLGVDAVQVPVWRGGRGVGAPWSLISAAATDPDPSSRASAVRPPGDAGPHPGRMPVPLPALVFNDGRNGHGGERLAIDVLDGEGVPVSVSGRGFVSAPPATLVLDGRRATAITRWAGPWPIEEHWWDASAARRMARLQITTEDGTAWLVVRESGRWWLAASYR